MHVFDLLVNLYVELCSPTCLKKEREVILKLIKHSSNQENPLGLQLCIIVQVLRASLHLHCGSRL